MNDERVQTSLFGRADLVRPGSFTLQNGRICTAESGCQFENSVSGRAGGEMFLRRFSTLQVSLYFGLAPCMYSMVLESQLLPNIVNLMF